MRAGRRPRGPPLLPLTVAAVLFAVLLLPGVSGALATGGLPPPRSALAATLGGPLSFAGRAGYDPPLAAGVRDVSPAAGSMSVVVSFQPSNPGLYDPPTAGSPAMTPSQVAEEYGLSPSAYASAEAYFESWGLSVQHTWPDRLSLTLQGTAPQFAAAFATSLVSGDYQGRSVTYPVSPPALPAALEAEIAGVVGLSTGFTTFTLPFAPASTLSAAGSAPGSPTVITPGIARQIYGGSALYNYTGSSKFAVGETIVLLLWGNGYAPSDLSTFYSTYYPSSPTFPKVTYTPVPIDGAPWPSPNATSDPSVAPQELTLDLEWSGSLAPGANLDAVYAPDGPAANQYSPTVSTMTDALNEAVTGISGVDVISMSFGTTDAGGGLEAAWTNDLAEAMQEHITLLAATGDTGGDATGSPTCSGGPAPEYPAVDPDVLAVGGTDPSLATNLLGQVTGIASESAWSNSGGGYSTQFADPAWQLVGSAAAPISAAGHRGTPDVSAASNNDFVYYDGGQRAGRGTSFATPLWGGLVAEMDAQRGSPLGWIDGPLYSVGAAEPQGGIPDGLVDITAGSNCLGPAGTGWDAATGWGSPRGVALYADLTASIVDVSLSASPVPAGPGSSVSLTVHVANATSGQPLVGIPVLVTLTADTSIGPCEGLFGSGEPSTNASGDVVVSVAVPACYLGSKAVASAEVTSNGLYGSAQAVLAVNLLGYLTFLGPLASPPGDLILYALIMGTAIAAGLLLGGSPRGHRAHPSPAPPTGTTFRRSPPSTGGSPGAPGSGGTTSPPAPSPTPPPVPPTPYGPAPSEPVAGFSEENT